MSYIVKETEDKKFKHYFDNQDDDSSSSSSSTKNTKRFKHDDAKKGQNTNLVFITSFGDEKNNSHSSIQVSKTFFY